MHRKQIVFILLRWLALTLIGWLIYALVRALWTGIRLGVPPYDWQWYLAIILLLIGLAARLVFGFPRSRLALCAFAGLLIWAIIGYGGFGQVEKLYPGRASPIPISFWSSTAIAQASETVLNDLRAAGGYLYLSSSLSERAVILRSRGGKAAGATKNLAIGAFDSSEARFFGLFGASE